VTSTVISAGTGVGDGRPFRLGFLLHLDSDLPPARAYREAIDLFVTAEALGYDSGWVIHRHFAEHARLLAATAQDLAPLLGWRPLSASLDIPEEIPA
jgi:alkanesulfonate monooxygenase SsuD/methylene tetrahydromethanopterin reductase-like flavin-dependent oxidoreductase (luciferase family)